MTTTVVDAAGLTVVPAALVRIAHYAPGSSWGPWQMTDYEVVWLMSGSAVRTVDDTYRGAARRRSIRLEPGSIIVSRPGTHESYSWDPDRHSTHAWVHFDALLPREYPPGEEWPEARRLDEHLILAGLTDYLLDAAAGGSGSNPRSAEILALLVDLYVRGPIPQRASGLASARTTRLAEIVRTVWSKDGVRAIAVDEISTALGVSREHLSREFAVELKIGVARALELLRLGQAAVALQRTDQTVEEISRALGFASPYHFSRRFAKAYGLPPGRFRASGLDEDPLAPIRLAGLTSLWDAVLRSA
jgi:AraC-like DNA-binding protein